MRFDNKPRKDGEALAQQCLGLDKEKSAITPTDVFNSDITARFS